MVGNFEQFRLRYILLDTVTIFFGIALITGLDIKMVGVSPEYLKS